MNPDRNLDYDWLIEVENEVELDNDYVVLSTSLFYHHTRFTFLKAGLYKVTITTVITDLVPSSPYFSSVYKDGENIKTIFFVLASDTFEHVNVNCFIESNGTNYFEFSCYSFGNNFGLTPDQEFNQLSIEFVQ
jgi:hypothetical protein